ncbi:PAS domain S-box-containing protein/diguanylate cyclase (GGDEF)-like protein [Rhodobacter aestuarii]|uniref:PAS domain S-box-containing protein/diguanylate cyclase (GGDEF) domain-containing protein n=1 Tax=Rhodobacter aestuarii TaxID=453582 RepID=A0A1N7NPP4_9RHOB|nr:PAS domain-containing protein [Rhodobacter aestuarii]PTV94634.1 PAS domain S-box-containing protein/diguanylate cyclase (GGDEF)-like protein [Rhodobacter aestuarii]SIT00287.1 PAS domain S-box-containing protein/diguanylate cyclase (GGDEF) domain-containing protein [Rhodobacter aestuarii]
MSGAIKSVETVLSGFPGAVVLCTHGGELVWGNPVATRAFGGGVDLAGRSVFAVLPDALGNRLAQRLEEACATPNRFRIELEAVSGPPRPLEITTWSFAPGLCVVQMAEPVMDLRSQAEVNRLEGALEVATKARLATEAQLRTVQERADVLRISAESSNTVAWHLFPGPGIGEIGAHFAPMLGYPEGFEISLESMRELIHPDDQSTAGAEFQAMCAGETDSFSHDFRIKRADGTWAWITSRGRRVDRSDRGLPDMLCGSFADITDRKESEAWVLQAFNEAQAARNAAATSAELMKTAMACGGFGVWVVCAERGEAWMNDEGYTAMGYAPGEFRPDDEGWRSLYHPDDLPPAIVLMEDLIFDRSEVFDNTARLRHKDGSYHWYRCVARKIDRSAQGLPFQVSGAQTCIDHLKENERQLSKALADAEHTRELAQERAELLRTSGLCAQIGHFSICPDLNEGWTPAETYRLFGYEPGAFPSTDAGWRSLIHPDDLSEATTEMQKLQSGEIALYAHEHRRRHADGSYHWYRAIARRVDRSDKGLPYLLAGAIINIDAVKENEARLAAAAHEAEAARARLDTLADNTPGALFEFRIDEAWNQNLPYFSAKLPQMLGVTREMLERDGALAFTNVPSEDMPEINREIEESRRNGTEYLAKLSVLHPELGQRWISISSIPFRQSDGSTVWFGTVLDVTEHMRVEKQASDAAKEVHRIHERMMTMAENAPGAIFEWHRTPDGHFEFAFFSAALPELMGVTRAALEESGAAVFTHFPTEDIAPVQAAVMESVENLTRFETQHRINHPVHGTRWIHVSAQPFAQPDGTIIWYGNTMDVTERVASEERAREAAEAVRVAHERMVTMAENAPGALFEWHRNLDGVDKLVFFTGQLSDLTGVSREALEANASGVFTHIPPEDAEQIAAEMGRTAVELSRFEMRFRLEHPEKGPRWIHLMASPVPAHNGGTTWYGNATDITARVAAKQREAAAAETVRQAHERLAWIANIAPVGLYEFKLAADGTTSVPYASPFFEDLMGVGYGVFAEGSATTDIFANVHPDDLPNFLAADNERDPTLEFWSQRFRVNHPTRGEIWLANSATPKTLDDGSVVWTGAIHDVTADVRREAELRRAHRMAEDMRAENEHQALHDGLTALPNRRYYDQMLARRIAQGAAGETPDCTLIRIDLDHFKHVNDTLGHEAGDLVLVRVAEVLRKTLRASDFAARIGGDEFSILLAPGSGRHDAEEIVERMQSALAEPLMYEGRQCRFGASFGIAVADNIAQMGTEIQLFADAALYRAKEGGRNRLEFFTPELHQNLQADRRIAAELQEGLDRSEFVPFFQAQVSAKDGSLTGVETLLRWRHPERGTLAPDKFMHVAEQLRIVPEIDRVMMEKSRDALSFWEQNGLLMPKISFNVSAGRMHDPDVVESARSLARGKTHVTFELLESILVEEESDAFRFHLDAIREAGIEIEIDDFGSGHASIIGLMQIAPSALKIDQRIVAPVARDPRAANLVKAIVEIAETLGIGTVAEGVETEDQAEILRTLGCDVLQGYLFSVPLSAEDFLAMRQKTRKIA